EDLLERMREDQPAQADHAADKRPGGAGHGPKRPLRGGVFSVVRIGRWSAHPRQNRPDSPDLERRNFCGVSDFLRSSDCLSPLTVVSVRTPRNFPRNSCRKSSLSCTAEVAPSLPITAP